MNVIMPKAEANNIKLSAEEIAVGLENRDRIPWLALTIIAAITLVTRFWTGVNQSFTFDEIYEILLAQQPISEILARGDGFPPLYALVLQVWQYQLGPETGRTLSIAFGLLAVLGMYALGNQIGGRDMGLWSAGITALLPVHIFYTSELRAYSILLAVSTFALYFAIKALRDNRPWDWIGFGFLALIGHHTHYLFVLFVGMTLLVVWLQRPTWSAVATGAAIAVGTIPLIFVCMTVDVAMQKSLPYNIAFGVSELVFTYASFLTGFTLGPSLPELHSLSVGQAVRGILPWAVTISASLLAVLFAARRDLLPPKGCRALLLTLATGPFALALMCLTIKIGYHPRYVIWTIVPIVLWLAWLALHASTSPVGLIGISGLTICFLAAIYNRQSNDRYRNEDVAAIAKFLTDPEVTKNPVLVVSGYMAEPFKYYLPDDWQVTGVPMESPYDDRAVEFTKILNHFAQTQKTFWFVYTRSFHEDPDGALFAVLKDRFVIERVTHAAGVDLYKAHSER